MVRNQVFRSCDAFDRSCVYTRRKSRQRSMLEIGAKKKYEDGTVLMRWE